MKTIRLPKADGATVVGVEPTMYGAKVRCVYHFHHTADQ